MQKMTSWPGNRCVTSQDTAQKSEVHWNVGIHSHNFTKHKHKIDQTKTHRIVIVIVDVQWHTIARHHKMGSMQALVQ